MKPLSLSLSLSLSAAAAMIVVGPRNADVPIGQSATFSCNISAEPTPTVTWEFNGTEIVDGSKYNIMITSDVTATTLTVSNLMVNDTGTYACHVENVHGNENSSADLTVQSKFYNYALCLM